ncbi:MAG: hypothetical protein ACJ788_04465 [Ktedonobacteraceae bacterium]
MQGKVCLVTGANGSIGKYTALGLAQRGTTVVSEHHYNSTSAYGQAKLAVIMSSYDLARRLVGASPGQSGWHAMPEEPLLPTLHSRSSVCLRYLRHSSACQA